MRKRLFTLFLLPVCCTSLNAQVNATVDKIRAKLATARADTAKVELLADLGLELFDSDPKAAMDCYAQVEQLSNSIQYPKGLLHVFLGKGIFMESKNAHDSAFYFYNKGIALSQKLGLSSWECTYSINKGLIYLHQSKYPECLREYEKAERIAEKSGYRALLADILRKKANLVAQSLDYSKAHGYLLQSLAIYEQLKDTARVGEVLGSIGYAYRNEKQPDSAIRYFKKAVTKFKELRYFNMLAVAYTEIGKAYFEMKENGEAVAYYNAAESIYDSIHYFDHQDALQVFIGDALRAGREYDAALVHYEKGLKIALQTKDMEVQSDACFGLYKTYARKKDFPAAMQRLEAYDSLKDEIARRKQLSLITEMNDKYETERKDEKIALLNKTATIRQLELQRKTQAIAGISIASALALLSAYLFYRRYKSKQEQQLKDAVAEQQRIATKALFSGEQQERIRIARDLHDSIGQMLSGVKMRLSALQNNVHPGNTVDMTESIRLVDKTIQEVRTISHNLIPEVLNFGLVRAIDNLCDGIRYQGNTSIDFNYDQEVAALRLDKPIELSVYRIVQEVLVNMTKHAAASMISIELLMRNDKLYLTLKDNGRGFDPQSIDRSEGLGWKNIRARVDLLNGQWQLRSAQLTGTEIQITIPGNEPFGSNH